MPTLLGQVLQRGFPPWLDGASGRRSVVLRVGSLYGYAGDEVLVVLFEERRNRSAAPGVVSGQ
jgi:hypothetical protein